MRELWRVLAGCGGIGYVLLLMQHLERRGQTVDPNLLKLAEIAESAGVATSAMVTEDTANSEDPDDLQEETAAAAEEAAEGEEDEGGDERADKAAAKRLAKVQRRKLKAEAEATPKNKRRLSALHTSE